MAPALRLSVGLPPANGIKRVPEPAHHPPKRRLLRLLGLPWLDPVIPPDGCDQTLADRLGAHERGRETEHRVLDEDPAGMSRGLLATAECYTGGALQYPQQNDPCARIGRLLAEVKVW
jgi:hypothetical protein